MDQTLINWIIGGLGTLLGACLAIMWQAVQALQGEMSALRVLVAGDYVKWEGLRDVLRPISDQLLRIEGKLDRKADK